MEFLKNLDTKILAAVVIAIVGSLYIMFKQNVALRGRICRLTGMVSQATKPASPQSILSPTPKYPEEKPKEVEEAVEEEVIYEEVEVEEEEES